MFSNSNRESISVAFRTGVIGLSALLQGLKVKTVAVVYSRDILKLSGIRRFGIGVGLLSSLRTALGNGEPRIGLLGNALLLSAFSNVLHQATSHVHP